MISLAFNDALISEIRFSLKSFTFVTPLGFLFSCCKDERLWIWMSMGLLLLWIRMWYECIFFRVSYFYGDIVKPLNIKLSRDRRKVLYTARWEISRSAQNCLATIRLPYAGS
jgi:hypothetical protein